MTAAVNLNGQRHAEEYLQNQNDKIVGTSCPNIYSVEVIRSCLLTLTDLRAGENRTVTAEKVAATQENGRGTRGGRIHL